MKKGSLIVIDGADGSGKATQTKLLAERLKSEGVAVETLDFPQYENNTFGSLIRKCQDGEHGDFSALDPYIASALYAADRFESRDQLNNWLSEGKTVVLDRYVSANMLHQGGKLHDEAKLTEFLTWLDHMEHYVFDLPRPAVIIYLDVPFDDRKRLLEQRSKELEGRMRDTLERDDDYQKAAEERARYIIKARNEWRSVACTEDSKLRTKSDIHADVYALVSEYIV